MINFLYFLIFIFFILNVHCFIYVFWKENELAHEFSQSKDLKRASFAFALTLFLVKDDNEVEEIIEFIEVSVLGFYITIDFLINGEQISMNIRHRIHQLVHNLLFLELQHIQIKMNVIDSVHLFITHLLLTVLLRCMRRMWSLLTHHKLLRCWLRLLLSCCRFLSSSCCCSPLFLHTKLHGWNDFALVFFLNGFGDLRNYWRWFIIVRGWFMILIWRIFWDCFFIFFIVIFDFHLNVGNGWSSGGSRGDGDDGPGGYVGGSWSWVRNDRLRLFWCLFNWSN